MGCLAEWLRSGNGMVRAPFCEGVGFQRSHATESARYGGLAECSWSGKFEIELFCEVILARRHMFNFEFRDRFFGRVAIDFLDASRSILWTRRNRVFLRRQRIRQGWNPYIYLDTSGFNPDISGYVRVEP